MNIIGNVEGKKCIIIDDMIDTAGTLCKASKALKNYGAEYVAAYATHGVFSGNAYENIEKSELDEVIITDTILNTGDIPDKIRIISIAELLGETLVKMREHKSISQIYTE
jgi:ribose-phosphate pyrophosphokinase